MTRWTHRVLVVSWLLLLGASVGCEDDPLDLAYLNDSGTDAGVDAGAAGSGGGVDASAADSGSTEDASTNDAGADDAGN